MKTTFPIVCPSCGGSGVIPEPFPTTIHITKICPACEGSGVVIKTETKIHRQMKREELIKLVQEARKGGHVKNMMTDNYSWVFDFSERSIVESFLASHPEVIDKEKGNDVNHVVAPVNVMQVIHDFNMAIIFSDLIHEKTCGDFADIMNKVLTKHNLLTEYQNYIK